MMPLIEKCVLVLVQFRVVKSASAPFKARHNLPVVNQLSVIGVKSAQWSK
jgi:hypothetical protein